MPTSQKGAWKTTCVSTEPKVQLTFVTGKTKCRGNTSHGDFGEDSEGNEKRWVGAMPLLKCDWGKALLTQENRTQEQSKQEAVDYDAKSKLLCCELEAVRGVRLKAYWSDVINWTRDDMSHLLFKAAEFYFKKFWRGYFWKGRGTW